MAIQGPEAAKQLFWRAQPPRGGEGKSCSLHRSWGPDAPLACYPTRPSGMKRNPADPRGQSAPPGPPQPPTSPGSALCSRCPHAALPPLAPRPPAAGLFWVLGGYFPSGPTSLPVNESEVGAGPPLCPPPPASSCHLEERPRPIRCRRLLARGSRSPCTCQVVP